MDIEIFYCVLLVPHRENIHPNQRWNCMVSVRNAVSFPTYSVYQYHVPMHFPVLAPTNNNKNKHINNNHMHLWCNHDIHLSSQPNKHLCHRKDSQLCHKKSQSICTYRHKYLHIDICMYYWYIYYEKYIIFLVKINAQIQTSNQPRVRITCSSIFL